MSDIRPATVNDLPAIEDVVRRAYEPFAQRIGFRPAPLDADYGMLIAAGQVRVTDPDLDAVLVLAVESGSLSIENVAVHPDARHCGIGGQLMAYALDHAAETGITTVRLYTHSLMTENIAWYAALGFVETGREPLPVGERLHMAKELID